MRSHRSECAFSDVRPGGDHQQWQAARLGMEADQRGGPCLGTRPAAQYHRIPTTLAQHDGEPVNVGDPLGEDQASCMPCKPGQSLGVAGSGSTSSFSRSMPLVMARYRHPLAPRLAPQPATCPRSPPRYGTGGLLQAHYCQTAQLGSLHSVCRVPDEAGGR